MDGDVVVECGKWEGKSEKLGRFKRQKFKDPGSLYEGLHLKDVRNIGL